MKDFFKTITYGCGGFLFDLFEDDKPKPVSRSYRITTSSTAISVITKNLTLVLKSLDSFRSKYNSIEEETIFISEEELEGMSLEDLKIRYKELMNSTKQRDKAMLDFKQDYITYLSNIDTYYK